MTFKTDVSNFLSDESNKNIVDTIFTNVDVLPKHNDLALKLNFQLTALHQDPTDYGLYTYLKASRPGEDDIFIALYGYDSSYSGPRYISFNFVKMEVIITYRFIEEDK